MGGRECYHCKQWIEDGEPHDCWTTTESALTSDLSEDLQDAYQRLRETALELGEQRVYASHSSIMFSRKACYFFVRPKRTFLEVCIFLSRPIRAPQIRKAIPSSKIKVAHLLQIRHRDEVEAPITDWLRDAYRLEDELPNLKQSAKRAARSTRSRRTSAKGRKATTRARRAPDAKRKSRVKND